MTPAVGLSADAERTRRRHLRYALLEAIALGVLANAPVVALRSLGAPPWQLALALVPSSVGIFLDLYLGTRMARASKVPYVQLAIGVFSLSALGMAASDDPLVFNLLHGVGNLGQIIAQMALGGVVRAAYPPEVRGAIAGRVRRFSALAFLTAAGATALTIDLAADAGYELPVARALIGVAALVAFVGALSLRTLPITGADTRAPRGDEPDDVVAALRSAQRIVTGDARFRRYIVASIFSAFGGLCIAPFVNAFLVRDLALAYLPTIAIAQLLPKLCAFTTTEFWGRLADGRNPWGVWAIIRTLRGSSFALLALAAFVTPSSALAGLVIVIASKALYGTVMGGSWILYWQLSVAHFAPPGADTSRYMGLVTAVSGAGRLVGPSLGALALAATGAVAPVFLVGASFVLTAAALCARGLRLDGDDPRYRTIAAFEASNREESP